VRVLDRYVLGTYAKAFAGGMVVFSLTAVTLDFFTRLNQLASGLDRAQGALGEGSTSLGLVVRFYVAYLPFLWKQVLPFVAVASATMTVSGMLRANEVFPILATGTSVRRLLAPIFLCGALVSAAHFAFQEAVVPSLSREQILLKRLFSGDRSEFVDDLPFLRDGRGTVVRAGSFRFADRSLHDVILLRPWEGDGFETLRASELKPREGGGGWSATYGASIQPTAPGAPRRELAPGAPVAFDMSPEEVEALVSKQGTEELSLAQLAALARRFPDRALRVAYFRQFSVPLASFVLVLVAVPALLFAARSYFVGAGIAFFLCGSYFFADIFCTSLGDRGELEPATAAFLPLAAIGSLGVAGLVTVRT
jgi:lipopolysaccharide export system permease protein